MIEFVLVISRFKLSLMLLGKKEFRDRCTSILGMQMLFILAKHISERLSHSFLLWLSVTRIELASSKQAFFGSEELLSDLRKMLSSSSHTCFDFNPLSLTEQNRLAFFLLWIIQLEFSKALYIFLSNEVEVGKNGSFSKVLQEELLQKSPASNWETLMDEP